MSEQPHVIHMSESQAAAMGLIGEPSPELAEAREAYAQAMRDQQITEREQMIRWSMVFCSCARRYAPGEPPQAGCLVHGGFMTTYDGRVL